MTIFAAEIDSEHNDETLVAAAAGELAGESFFGPATAREALAQLVALAKAPEGHCDGCRCRKFYTVEIEGEALAYLRKLSKLVLTVDVTDREPALVGGDGKPKKARRRARRSRP